MDVLKQKIKRIVREEINKQIVNTQRSKIDLNRVFDLSKIPDEELKRQHYDLSLIHSISGFGSELLKDKKGNYITENDKRVTPITVVIQEIKTKYHLENWQIYCEDRGHDIQFCICIANFPNAVKEITEDLKQMGYFLANTQIGRDRFGLEWNRMQFEPIYQVDEANEILNYGDLFHWTPSFYLQNILNEGLQPRSQNDLFDYPDRIFMFRGDTPMGVIQSLGYELYKFSTDPNNNGDYSLLRINSDGLRQGYEIHYDPNFTYGVFTQKPIPPNLLSVYANMIFKK